MALLFFLIFYEKIFSMSSHPKMSESGKQIFNRTKCTVFYEMDHQRTPRVFQLLRYFDTANLL